ncbi:hypothetical protein AWB66_03339 [Caballeronia telluris]|uniref:XRE family transcriptional regulator n=1 Tax=Caballeronia telluris TaxID=326475 RepID=A0A158ISF7_9BURK|nr:hypothetical protein AWB66_03339 [Caballeronia telluris]
MHEPPFEIAVKLAEVLRLPAAYFYCEDEDLAGVVLAWGRLPKPDRRHLRKLVEAQLEERIASR